MATKFIFLGSPAYKEGPFALVKDSTDGLWRVFHIDTEKPAMWIVAPFKQKRDALAYAESLIRSGIDWSVNSRISLFDRNDMNHVHTVMSNLTRGMELV